MFNYIENIFKDDCNTNLQSINYADLQIINDEFNSIDDEFDNKKITPMIYYKNIRTD